MSKKTDQNCQKLDAPDIDSNIHKESLLKNLLGDGSTTEKIQNPSQGKRLLIAEINENGEEIEPKKKDEPEVSLLTPLVTPVQVGTSGAPKPPATPLQADDGPSMLELMMEAQKAALSEKKSQQAEEQKKAAKTGFGGFKKGFFGNNSNPSKKTPASTHSNIQSSKNATNGEKDAIIEVKKSAPVSTSNSKPNKDQIVEEVQRAMEEDQNPLLKQLKSNEWVTGDLMSMISNNPVLSQGMKNPRCVAAMELLQRDPKEAQKRFERDPEVGVFLQEFCKIMSVHFTALGERQDQRNNAPPATAASGKVIEEIGPLQARALAKQKESVSNLPATPSTSSIVPSSSQKSSKSSSTSPSESEEERVQRILADPELRTLLMDPGMQQILLECGDPSKLRKHMQNPETVRKIRKLADAGLVKLEV